jgi:hypothetical protein
MIDESIDRHVALLRARFAGKSHLFISATEKVSEAEPLTDEDD